MFCFIKVLLFLGFKSFACNANTTLNQRIRNGRFCNGVVFATCWRESRVGKFSICRTWIAALIVEFGCRDCSHEEPCRLGRWRDGIAELREVLRVDPDNADAAKALYVALDETSAHSGDGAG
jgi:hypothetical protein